jgi:prepilin-type N-terminal cleavage/methylation domain-containing protein
MAMDRSIPMFRWSPRSLVKPHPGFTLVELLLALAITVFMTAVLYGLLTRAQLSFYDSEAKIKLRNELRLMTQKIDMELRQSGYDGTGAPQFTILTGVGFNGSDILRFSVPVICESGGTLLDATGNPAHWGATIKWGCTTSACADANDSCASVEYKYIQYSMNGSGQIIRSVLSPIFNTVSTQALAEDITGFKVSIADMRMMTLAVDGQRMSTTRRVITASVAETIRLMN